VLPVVYKDGIKNILDIGGNTGKWATISAKYSPEVRVTIMDLPGQLGMAKAKIESEGLTGQVSFLPVNILNEQEQIPKGFDAIWMSQFLDCFSENEIVSILRRCHDALDENGRVIIMEPLWDRQQYEIAAFCLQQTSLYFTAIANGNSQMYSAEVFIRCIDKAGFDVVEEMDNIGLSQTILKCRKK